MDGLALAFPIFDLHQTIFSADYGQLIVFSEVGKYFKNCVMWFGFPFWFFTLVVCYSSFLSAHQYSISNPAQTRRCPHNFTIIETNIDSTVSY